MNPNSPPSGAEICSNNSQVQYSSLKEREEMCNQMSRAVFSVGVLSSSGYDIPMWPSLPKARDVERKTIH